MKYRITYGRHDIPDEKHEFNAKSNKEAIKYLLKFKKRGHQWDDCTLEKVLFRETIIRIWIPQKHSYMI